MSSSLKDLSLKNLINNLSVVADPKKIVELTEPLTNCYSLVVIDGKNNVEIHYNLTGAKLGRLISKRMTKLILKARIQEDFNKYLFINISKIDLAKYQPFTEQSIYQCLVDNIDVNLCLGCCELDENITLLIANRKNETIKNIMQGVIVAISNRTEFKFRDHSYKITEENIDQVDIDLTLDIQERIKYVSIIDHIFSDSDDE